MVLVQVAYSELADVRMARIDQVGAPGALDKSDHEADKARLGDNRDVAGDPWVLDS